MTTDDFAVRLLVCMGICARFFRQIEIGWACCDHIHIYGFSFRPFGSRKCMSFDSFYVHSDVVRDECEPEKVDNKSNQLVCAAGEIMKTIHSNSFISIFTNQ